jgi:transcriptional regulator with GAF, ATPase, and Fis domain
MEYFEGKPFNEFFARGYSDELIPAMIEVLLALDAIHCQGLCHCDMKPQNVLVARTGEGQRLRVKLLDFGFAERVSVWDAKQARGTLGYIAPEVFKGTGVDARADIYSLGMMVYEVLTGEGPSKAKDVLEWLRRQYSGGLGRPVVSAGAQAEGLADLVSLMISRDREERPRSCLEVLETLSRISGIAVQLPVAQGPENYLLATGFIGRDDSLEKLAGLLKGAASGKGSVVFISGERGIGKSRLMMEFKFLAELEGARIFRFTPASLGARPQSLLEGLLGYLKDQAGVDVSRILAGVGNTGRAGADDDQDELNPDERSGESEKFRLFECACASLREVALRPDQEHCLVLLIDDFELFDPTSLEFLRYLVSSLDSDRIMVSVCGLNERRLLDLIGGLKNKPCVQHIALVPLTRPETKYLVSSVLGAIPQLEDVADWLYEGTGGNPLFLIETIYSLIDKGILRLSASRWTANLEDLRAYRVPDTVSEVIKRRLKGLSPDELDVLRVGAVCGMPLTIDFLRIVLGYEEKQLFNSVSRLKAMGLMRPYAVQASSALLLSSKMLESVVMESISLAERQESHRRVALALELLYPGELNRLVFDLAHHYTQAGIKDRAYSYSLKAGERALAFHLTDQALSYFETALGVAPSSLPPRDRLALMDRLGELHQILGHFQPAIDLYMQGTGIIVADKELYRSSELMPEFLRNIGIVHQRAGNDSEALRYFESAAAMIKGQQTYLSVSLLLDMGWSQASERNYARAEKLYLQAAELLPKLGPPPLRKTFKPGIELGLETALPSRDIKYERLAARIEFYRAALEWHRGNSEQALRLITPVIRRFEDRNQTGQFTGRLSHLSQFAATLYLERGDSTQALLLYERYLPLQRKSNDVIYLMRTLNGIGIIKLDCSDWDSARLHFQESLGFAERVADHAEIVSILNNLGYLQEESGDWELARTNYLDSQRLALEQGMETHLCATLTNLAGLASKRGDLEQAETLLKDAASIAAKTQHRPRQQEVLLEQIRLELRRERLALARDYLLRAYRINLADHDLRLRPDLRLAAAQFHLATNEPAKALTILNPLLKTGTPPVFGAKTVASLFSAPSAQTAPGPGNSPFAKLTARAQYLAGQAFHQLNRLPEARAALEQSITLARNLRTPYEIGLGILALASVRTAVNHSESLLRLKPALALRSLDPNDITQALAEVQQAKEIFQRLSAKLDLQRADELQQRITQLASSTELRPQHQSEYLRVFYQLTEIVNQGLEQEDFMDRILDLVIEVTGAERGVLFLTQAQGQTLIPAVGRQIDHTTLQDAQSISRTLIRQLRRRSEPIMTPDAVSDPRFNTSNSVVLNKIRSILAGPLQVGDRVIGAIYVDSRINTHLFWDEDKILLMSVANLLAATIEKSIAFSKIQEQVGAYREDIMTDAAAGRYLGRSPPMRRVYQLLERVAPTDVTVLLQGPTGSGKNVFAQIIHNLSPRKARPFAAIDCGTLPPALIESELFGHCKGSFTGAVRDKAGLFETAEGGTIFLDEIANIDLEVQGKLLRAIEEKVIRWVGETQLRTVDVRIICATKTDLAEEARLHRFREDLYYRLNTVTISLPALHATPDDIPQLAAYFLRRSAKDLNKPILGFEPEAIRAIQNYPWPGNIRELQNVIERATIMCPKRKIGVHDLGLPASGLEPPIPILPDDNHKHTYGREDVVKALAQTRGNVSEAAKLLSTHRRQVQRLIKRYSIDKSNPT